MKIFILLIISTILSFALDIKELKTFEADFKQSIINNSNNEIIYQGKIYIKHPSLFFWKYNTPIEKLVYITKKHVTIIEPELEQAVISKLSDELNIIKLLEESKKIDKNTYEAILYNKKYTLTLKENRLDTIKYTDELDNKITLTFLNAKQNKTIDNQIFKYNIPYEYDVIRKY